MPSSNIENIFDDFDNLPPGIWDNPTPADFEAYNEFMSAYYADEQWTAADSTNTVRALSYDYLDDMRGGVKVDGASPRTANLQQEMFGGVKANGNSRVTHSTTYYHEMQGGIQLDGQPTPSKRTTPPTLGGTKLNGASPRYSVLRQIMLGGTKHNSTARISKRTTVSTQGGTIVIGTWRYRSGHLYRCMVRVPVGKVSAPLTDFPLMLSFEIDADKRATITGQEDFYFENNGQPLPHKLVGWDGERVHVLVKTDLTPNDNWIVCYYGGLA